MPVGVQLDFKGATLEQYDDVLEATGFLPGGPTGPMALFHWVAKTEEGIRIVDVWESVEAFEEFTRTRSSDAFADAGVSEPPQIQFFEVHNYLIGGRPRR